MRELLELIEQHKFTFVVLSIITIAGINSIFEGIVNIIYAFKDE